MKKYIIYGLIFATVLAIIYMIYQRGQQAQLQQEQPFRQIPQIPQPQKAKKSNILPDTKIEGNVLADIFSKRTEDEKTAYQNLGWYAKGLVSVNPIAYAIFNLIN